MKDNKHMLNKIVTSLSEEGVIGFAKRTGNYIEKKVRARRPEGPVYRDVLFISGCREDLPHPWRYRVKHQREQLEACHLSTGEVYFQDLSFQALRFYRAFVFFRCPYTETIGKFVTVAKRLNKPVLYDVDDLVVDTVYTDQIPYVQQMSPADKAAYDENVRNMGKLLKACDGAVTTTGCLAEELRKYVPDVRINRNTASEEMTALSRAALSKREPGDKVRIGYFSGSITHNADVALILPVLQKIMETYKNVELCLMGELDLPDELKGYPDRIEQIPFSDWRELPERIASVDINLAPLEDTIFNRAKSENKWLEASLVQTVTVASDVGAFHDCIVNGETGVLCADQEEWFDALEELILHPERRSAIAKKAYAFCLEQCTTIGKASQFGSWMRARIPENYVFVLPGLEISGGMKVAFKHAKMLWEQGGDVTFFTLDNQTPWINFEGHKFPVLSIRHTDIRGYIGTVVATMWTTAAFAETYPNVGSRTYLVQNYETDFYQNGDPLRVMAEQTYSACNHMQYLTISKWCQDWLEKRYHQKAKYAPNGLETERFSVRERTFDGKVRILIEGDCAVDYKNVDEAFRIVEMLDRDRYEIWYMSYNAQPKEWYRVDRFCHRVPYEQVPDIYRECDILLKTSLLESFSYPPLEMMATGGMVVAVPNGGNAEYLRDEVNCLLYEAGDLKKGKEQIERICEDAKLRETLAANGRRIAEERQWESVRAEILKLYV